MGRPFQQSNDDRLERGILAKCHTPSRANSKSATSGLAMATRTAWPQCAISAGRCGRKPSRSPLLGNSPAWRGILSYVVDVTAIDDRIEQALSRYRDVMQLIVEDEAIQSGAATFRGTRILVHQIAELVGQGTDTAELQEDYPRLTPKMIAAAPVYARAHPRRGRPPKPSWRASPARIGPTREG